MTDALEKWMWRECAAVPVWLWVGVWLMNREGCPMAWGGGMMAADAGGVYRGN